MRKCFLIALSNIRKAKGQTISIIVLIFIAAVMLNLWLMLSMDYKANFDRYHKKLNAEHVTLSVDNAQGEVQDSLETILKKESNVSKYCLDDCMHMAGTFPYNGGEMTGWFIFLEKETALTRSVGRSEIVEEGNLTSGIYLPMLYKSEDIDVGKSIEISIGSHIVEYTVCGFFNNLMMGSHNCALTELILTEDKYQELKETKYASLATLCSVRLKDKTKNLEFEAEIKSLMSKQFPTAVMMSNCYNIVVQSRYISQMICSGIMSAMAFLVLLIALVVIASSILNYIQINMKNLGALKALGYTSIQLICTQLVQFLGLTLLAAILGVGISYALFPFVNEMMIAQTGIPYQMHFLILPFILSVLILGVAVLLVVFLASKRIKKIEPIVALRFGVQTHNFKENHIPLEKTKAPLNLALALKTTFSGIKHNLTVCITMLILSLVVAFSGLMIENVIRDMTPFLNLIVGETADSCISINSKMEEEFIEELKQDDRVKKVYLYTSLNVSHVGGAELQATLCDDFSRINNQDVVFEGRFPKFDNEIALAAKYAKERGFKIGNEIEITANGKQEKYLICGFTQVTNYLGRDCLFTREGYEKLGEIPDLSYYINLDKKTDIDLFHIEMKERFAGSINGTINIQTTIEGAAGVYVSLMTIIVIAIFVISGVIIAFVLFLLVRTMLNNKKKEYGILKSMGFTARQLIIQTALSFMPTIVISVIIGLTISSFIINPLTALFLSGIGIVKCTFTIPILFIVLAGVLLVLFAFALLCILSLKIKKISPYQILVGE
ncbi:MAG: ABC transporter permease [Anaeroplasma bactoclasticum]|nr:ABC transporter permease [Anaeroplasma bactoclasticum]MCM1556396.1 ABC transporter permease [Anaeroplasma bactoclasticum]